MTEDEATTIPAMRRTVDALVGSFRNYLRGDIQAIRPLVEPYSVEDLWAACCYLMSSAASLDGPDLSVTAERLRSAGARLRSVNPNPDPPMVAALLEVADALEGAATDDPGLNIPDLAGFGTEDLNAYPYLMAMCLALSINLARWTNTELPMPEQLPVILDNVVKHVDTVLDYAETVEQERLVAPFDDGAQDVAWVDEVEALTLLFLRWDSPGVPAEVEAVFDSKDPIAIGPYLMEVFIILTSMPQPGVESTTGRLHQMARAATLRPHHDDIAEAVTVLVGALSATTEHPSLDQDLFTPISRFSEDVRVEQVLAATAHVVNAHVEQLAKNAMGADPQARVRDYLAECARIATQYARESLETDQT